MLSSSHIRWRVLLLSTIFPGIYICSFARTMNHHHIDHQQDMRGSKGRHHISYYGSSFTVKNLNKDFTNTGRGGESLFCESFS